MTAIPLNKTLMGCFLRLERAKGPAKKERFLLLPSATSFSRLTNDRNGRIYYTSPCSRKNPFSGRDKGPDLRERLKSRLLNKNQSSKVHFLDSTSDLTNASSPVARDHSEGYLSKFLRKALRSFPSSPSRASRVLFLTQFVSRLALEKPVEEAVTSRFDF